MVIIVFESSGAVLFYPENLAELEKIRTHNNQIDFLYVMVDPLSCFSKAVVCAVLSGMVNIKEPLLLVGKVAHVATAGFLSRYLNGPLPYVRRHITVNKCVN